LGFSQGGFGSEVGVTKMTVYRWENGKALPSPLAMRAINRLEIKVNYEKYVK